MPRLLSRFLRKRGGVSLKCRITDTLILCACHHTPLKFKVETLERAKSGNFPLLCDVCRQIDLEWAKEMLSRIEEAERAHKELAKTSPWEALKVAPLPDLASIVARSIESKIKDYNAHPESYHSICEGKLQLARRVAENGVRHA